MHAVRNHATGRRLLFLMLFGKQAVICSENMIDSCATIREKRRKTLLRDGSRYQQKRRKIGNLTLRWIVYSSHTGDDIDFPA